MAARYRHAAGNASSKAPPEPSSPELSPPEPSKPLKKAASDSGAPFSILDALRVLGGILLLSCGVSYLSTSGESMTWGYNAWWTRAREWKALFKGDIYLTDVELLAYDGTDPNKPIYLALNGTIYDVSANRGTYGPGGSYHFFAGRDAARAFLTGCFQEDQTPDLRGVEWMYIPVDPSEKEQQQDGDGTQAKSFDPATGKETAAPRDADDPRDAHKKARAHDKRRKPLSKADLKNRHAQELRKARKQMREGLEHWHALFRGDKGKPYFKAGEVKREPGWLEKLPRRKLCEHAEKSRPVRKEE